MIVDAAGLVALGTDDVQATGSDDLVVHLLPLGFQAREAAGLVVGGQGLVVANEGNRFLDAAAEHDIRATARHVGGDGDHARATGLDHDLGFLGVLLGVQHLVRQLLLVEQTGQQLRAFDRGGAHQHRLAALMASLDVGDA